VATQPDYHGQPEKLAESEISGCGNGCPQGHHGVPEYCRAFARIWFMAVGKQHVAIRHPSRVRR